MILRELLEYFQNKGPTEVVTFEQIKREFRFKDLVYHHLASLISDGLVDKIPSGDIFLYRLSSKKINDVNDCTVVKFNDES